MDSKTFNNVIEAQLERSTSTLVKKAAEYATADRLHNFKVAADLQRVSTKVALAGMMAKHTVSVYDMMHSDEMFSEEMWNEKITDHINYLLLLQGIVTAERMEATVGGKIDSYTEYPTSEAGDLSYPSPYILAKGEMIAKTP